MWDPARSKQDVAAYSRGLLAERMLERAATALALLAGVSACSANRTDSRPDAGGSAGLGGASSGTTGGSSASGGAATGGLAATGGVTSSGGTLTGGVTTTGGRTTSGGSATGGAVLTGGKASAGGAATGGVALTGGKSGTGGGAGTGGEPSTGGVVTTGGTSGASGTGGMPTGGASNESGGASEGLTASEAAAAMGKGFNLGQTFESTQQPRTLAAASAKIDAYYAKGFRNVRIPITWTEAVGGDLLVNDANVGDVNRGSARLAVIEQVVDYALSKPDLFVVINAHHETKLKTQNRSSVLERLWQDIADIFGDRDHRLLFEFLNEPHQSDGSNSAMAPADLRNMVALAYAKIRAVDPERIVVIGGNQWFAAPEMAETWPTLDGVGGGQDAYVMATFHHYDPWTFCGDNQGSYDDPWTDSNLSTPMDTMLAWANSVGNAMPIYIGEWGVGWGSRYSQMQCNNIRQWYQKIDHDFAAPRGIPTAVWDDGGWFKIFDSRTNAFDNNLVDCIGGTCTWDGTERFNSGCQ
jgi:endoglucanase